MRNTEHVNGWYLHGNTSGERRFGRLQGVGTGEVPTYLYPNMLGLSYSSKGLALKVLIRSSIDRRDDLMASTHKRNFPHGSHASINPLCPHVSTFAPQTAGHLALVRQYFV